MPLKNGQFYDVVFRVHTGSFARMPLERDDFFLRKQLAPVQADDTLLLPAFPKFQVLQCDLIQIKGIHNVGKSHTVDVKRCGFQRFSVLGHQRAILVNLFDRKGFQIRNHNQICPVPRCYGTALLEPKILCRDQRCHFDGHCWVCAQPDRFTDVGIDVAAVQQVTGVLIIRHQHTAAAIGLPEQRYQGLHIFGSRSFPDHDVLSAPEFFHGFLNVGALVIGLNACRNISIQVLIAQERCVSIHDLSRFGTVADLLQDLRVTAHRPVGIHQFRKPQHTRIAVVRPELFCVQHRAGFIQIRGRHTGGQHEINRKGQIFCRFQHEIQAFQPRNVRDLVWVCDHRSGTVGQHCLLESRTTEHGAFDVDMPIDQARADIFAVQINFFPAMIRAHAHDRISADGNISGVDLIGKHIDNSGIFQNQISQSISSACRDPAFQFIGLHRNISSL